ncbi:MAG: peptide chain release factor 1, partial [Gemmatimonadetes bacterium]|nr:peptide chain release factor 1 [Gemmatimonadota bacterium]
VTDHRINFTLHRLADVIDGDLDELMDQLELAYREERVGV